MKQNGEGIVSGLKGTGNKGFALRRGRARAGSHGRLTATHRRLRRAPAPLNWMEIVERGARPAMRESFENALADRASDVYRFLEIMCQNELVEVELKKRKMDVLEVFRACNQGKALAMKAARVQSQNEFAETQTELQRLHIRLLKDKIAKMREKGRQAGKAKKGEKPFDYDRALN